MSKSFLRISGFFLRIPELRRNKMGVRMTFTYIFVSFRKEEGCHQADHQA